ncbi:MAG: bacteriohopanetetrol glucosamine biosynthesis glycosyltransferase HpnI [Acidobacteria bacterium]|nr:bacteriohopanetetrol glucosamine biosynthesis glycosyltransferase HpnI [Acidobacteriota bacterium]
MLPLLLLLPAAAALAYQAIALLASLVFVERSRMRRAKPLAACTPSVSILKPVHGLDEALDAAIRSHLAQDYPGYELLIGVQDSDDPALPVIRAAFAAYPAAQARLVVCSTKSPNAKVGTLIDLAREARGEILIVNDADIKVPADYVRRVAAKLANPKNGLVTCLYRASSSTSAGLFESIVIATDFIPSTLVAPLVGIDEFGLGSTLGFRRADLDSIGGFAAIQEYIADDYQLAKRIHALGRSCIMSEVVVDTHMADPGWKDVWRHQLRWARTIRVSRPGGYLGLPVTHAGVWAVANLAAGNVGAATALWLARSTMGAVSGFLVLRHWPSLLAAPFLPLWDLWAFAVWLAGYFSRTAWWRGRRITLSSDGRIQETR